MKALTLTQPWATLIAYGRKRIETRSWSTSFRGRIAIHAAKGLGPVGGKRGLKDQCLARPFSNYIAGWNVPLGAIVAVATIVKVVQIDMGVRAEVLSQTTTPDEFMFGDYTSGRYAWYLENVSPLPEPIYCIGALSLWEVPSEIDLSQYT